MEDRGCGDAEGVRRSRGVDTLLGISTYDCPEGVHRSAKQSSPSLDPSLRLSSRPSPLCPERGNVSRYTREHRGVGYLSAVRCRCCCLVSGSIYSTRTHDLRNSRGSPDRNSLFLSLFLFLYFSLFLILVRSLRCVCVYPVYLADPQQSSSFTGEADQSASRGFTVRGIRTTLVRLRVLLPATRQIRSLSFLRVAGVPIFFFERVRSRGMREREREIHNSHGRFEKTRASTKRGGVPIILRFCTSHRHEIYSLWKT